MTSATVMTDKQFALQQAVNIYLTLYKEESIVWKTYFIKKMDILCQIKNN